MILLIDNDTRLATQQNDGERIVANIRAMVGFVHQTREIPILPSHWIAQTFSGMMVRSLSEVLQHDAHVLTDEQLTELAHGIGSLNEIRVPDFEAVKWVMEDMFQRIYGSSGRITYEGLRAMEHLGTRGVGADIHYGALAGTPTVAALFGSHDQMSQELSRLMVMAREDVRRPLREMYLNLSRVGERMYEIAARRTSFVTRTHYMPVTAYLPALGRVARVMREHHTARQAVLVVLAAECYRRDHGAYPDAVADLVPRYLPTAPVDESAESGTLILKVTGDGIIVYGRGLDGDDDGGVAFTDYVWPTLQWTDADGNRMPRRFEWWVTWRTPKADGDWVLYPPPQGE